MSINELINKRYSTRAFSNRPVENEKIELLIEAASWAASAQNEQPWRFMIGEKGKGEYYQSIFQSLADSNQVWAKNAPVLILVLARKNFDYQNKPNRYAMHDTGMATANLLLQATDLGLFTHPMGGFNKDNIIAAFSIPDAYEPVTVIAVGYYGRVEDLPEELQKREKLIRSRKEFQDLIYSGTFDGF